MKKLLLSVLVLPTLFFSQVGINTANPQNIFHIDPAKDNPVTGVIPTLQQKDDVNVTQSGNLGLGTITPTEHLDVANGNVRIRDINSSVGSDADKLIVTDANGVLKRAGGAPFSITNGGNRVLSAVGGGNLTYITNWNDNTFTVLPLNEVYDVKNAYNPSTGEYVIQEDGYYYCKARVILVPGSGTFDGVGGTFALAIAVDGGTCSNGLVCNTIKVFRGTSSLAAANAYYNYVDAGAWFKAGQKINVKFLTFQSANMADNNNLIIDRSLSFFYIYKIF